MENKSQVQQDNNLSIYESVRSVPKEAKKEIEAGRLKGKHDISPMWRIKKLTEVFGPAGFGWYTEIVRTWTEASESGEMAVFVDINLFVKKDGEWSRPIFGNGGNKLIANEKKYENAQTVYIPYLDDDAYKKAYTDAISVAAKPLRHMAVIEGIALTQSQIQTILYIAYGVRLATKNERLAMEHPQMWQYGPVFPRAYNKLRKDASDGTDEYYSLKVDYPSIFKYLENCFRRYAWTKACILTAPHLSEGTPWSQTRKSNPDRWGVRIEDELTREWFLPRV